MFRSLEAPADGPDDRLRLLIVDDEPTLRLGFSFALKGERTRVETASGGRDALELLREKSYDVVLLDLRMPDIDGLNVIETLRREGNPVRIILCSAFITLDSALFAIRHGVADFLTKPVRPIDLRYALDWVTREPAEPMAQALDEVRKGEIEAAIHDFAALADHNDPKARLWHEILRCASGQSDPRDARIPLSDQAVQQIAIQAAAE